jgi:hypothetical protein
MGRMLILPDERTVRRSVERHADLLYGALPARSRALRRWVTAPSGNVAGVWFLTIGQPANATRNPSSFRRVRPRSPRSAGAACPGRGLRPDREEPHRVDRPIRCHKSGPE